MPGGRDGHGLRVARQVLLGITLDVDRERGHGLQPAELADGQVRDGRAAGDRARGWAARDEVAAADLVGQRGHVDATHDGEVGCLLGELADRGAEHEGAGWGR